VAGKYDLEKANWVLAHGYADLVAFGRSFVANPDLPASLAQGLPLSAFDPATLFGGAEHGYTDYPPIRQAA
jgi:N-ethylmaleimide reductase